MYVRTPTASRLGAAAGRSHSPLAYSIPISHREMCRHVCMYANGAMHHLSAAFGSSHSPFAYAMPSSHGVDMCAVTCVRQCISWCGRSHDFVFINPVVIRTIWQKKHRLSICPFATGILVLSIGFWCLAMQYGNSQTQWWVWIAWATTSPPHQI